METLYALTQVGGERVDEVRVVTTLGGKRRVLQTLLSPGGRFYQFCRDYQLDPFGMKFDETTIELLHMPDGQPLPDIRTVVENKLAGDQICAIVRELAKHPETRIHASAAGGRKTMGIYLTAAMQLFGRAQDTLSHLLVSEEFEGHQDFFYPPPEPVMLRTRDGREVSTAEATIHLASIPFIRLRGARSDWLEVQSSHNYVEVVRRAQENLDFLEKEYDLYLDLKLGRAVVGKGSRMVRLTPRELFFYAMFAWFRAEGRDGDGTVSLDRLTRADFDRAFRRIMRAMGDEVGIEECISVGKFGFLEEMVQQLESGREKDRLDFKAKFYTMNSRIRDKFFKRGLPAQYTLRLREERGSACYQLPLDPGRVFIA
jgi:CRISPR-associated protein (TIGR02584 family)